MRRKNSAGGAMTLVEMLVAMAIMVIVLATVVPQIRSIRSSWDSKRENVEAIQNGRVLVDHITSQLAEANSIAEVSDSNEASGYIQFLNNDGNTMRYEIDAGNYVVYGPVGNLSELTGPVSQLQFTCYDACDLDTPITDVNQIRNVKILTTMTNAAGLGRDQAFSGQAYLRTNSAGGSGGGTSVSEEPGSEFEFDPGGGQQQALCQINATHWLCAYAGAGDDGWAVILEVDTDNWTITKGTPLEFDNTSCKWPALARIDATNYLCAYTGPQFDGWAVILTVNTITDEVTMGTPFEFDGAHGEMTSLSQINSDDYLCAYRGPGAKGDKYGWAVILTVDTGTGTITKGTPFEFDAVHIEGPALANIDNVHYLCAYRFQDSVSVIGGKAVVLTVNTGTGTVTKETPFQFDPGGARGVELNKIDQEHYLCVYVAVQDKGYAVILVVDTGGSWAISKGTTLELSPEQYNYPALAWISGNDFLCAYEDFGTAGKAIVLGTDTQTDSVTSGAAYMHDERGGTPTLSKVDNTHFLCAYEGPGMDGWATILTIGSAIFP